MMRIGTVGTGFVVDDFFDAVSRVEGAEVTAVYSRTKQQADAFGDKHGVAKRYSDRAAFLADGDLDFIYVASPNSLHFSWAEDALRAGRNVLCEKPFASNAREVEQLAALAREKGLFLFECVTVPHLPNVAAIREQLPQLGQLKIAQANFSQYSSRYNKFAAGETPNVFNPEFSGGALMDINLYNINFFTALFGEPQEVRYAANIERGIDTSGAVLLRYPGFLCVGIGCKDSRSRNLAQIQGTAGYIELPQETSRALSFTLHRNADKSEQTFNLQEDSNALVYELRDFVKHFAARDLAARDALLDHSIMTARVIERARLDAGVRFPADD